MLPVEDYTPEELVQELIPEKHLLNDAGDMILAQLFSDTKEIVGQLIEFLFQTNETPREIFRDSENYILDLSPLKDSLIQFNVVWSEGSLSFRGLIYLNSFLYT